MKEKNVWIIALLWGTSNTLGYLYFGKETGAFFNIVWLLGLLVYLMITNQ